MAAQSLGVDLLRYKALAFGISGFYAGIAGGLYSALLNFVSPESYDLFQMVLHKTMVVVGGTAYDCLKVKESSLCRWTLSGVPAEAP